MPTKPNYKAELAYITSVSMTLCLAILNCFSQLGVSMVEISIIMLTSGLLFASRKRLCLIVDGALYALKVGYIPLKEKDESND